MKIISIMLLILLSCVNFSAQDNKESKMDFSSLLKGNAVIVDDGCGETATESQLYTNWEGKITKIISANELIFEQIISNGNKEKAKFIVELVGINPEINKKNIIQFLKEYLLNQSVEVTGNLQKESDKKFKGLIFVVSEDDDIDWINENLLDKGLAQYKTFESANLVPFNKPCQLQRAEERAKNKKLGIWAK